MAMAGMMLIVISCYYRGDIGINTFFLSCRLKVRGTCLMQTNTIEFNKGLNYRLVCTHKCFAEVEQKSRRQEQAGMQALITQHGKSCIVPVTPCHKT